jgi:hypothetical protein
VVRITQINYSGQTTAMAPGLAPTFLRDLGNFNKFAATTSIEIVWNSHMSGSMAVPGGNCNLQIRVDGSAPIQNGAFDMAVLQSPTAGPTVSVPVSTTDIFLNLASGPHTVSLWVRGVQAADCTDNPGNYSHKAIVTETQQ